MMAKTRIRYCDWTINFTKWFCTKVSEGCKYCYMMRLAAKSPDNSADKPEWRQRAMDEVRNAPSGIVVFANDMLDWQHELMPIEWIGWMLQAFASRPDITWLTLTKRIKLLKAYYELFGQGWGENVWIGTSVENEKRADRIDVLRSIPAAHRWVSFEPLIASVGAVDLTEIEQAITGGESGYESERRPFNAAWALEIRDLCRAQGVSYFHKQGGSGVPDTDYLINGIAYNDLAWRKPAVPVEQQASMF